VPFYVAVKGQAKIEAEIKEFSLTYKEGEGFSGYLLVENKGNVHLRPVITVAVPSDKQEHLKYFTLPLGVPIQAAKERKFEIKNERFYLEPGTYKINITCNYGDIYNVDKKVGKTTDFVIPATGEAVTVEYKGGSGK